MSKIYAIEAAESKYQGSHGIVSHFLTECNNFNEACEEAYWASEDLIYSYGLEPQPDGEDWESEDECADAWAEHILYSVWEVPDLKGHTIEELDKIFYNRPEFFIKEYCIDCE